jgi:beta-lactam-binding protein with PASTA domain
MRRWALVVLLATLGVLAAPGAAWAADPPDVRGLSVPDARARLTAWNDSVVLQILPQQPPPGVDQSTVVVATSTWLNPSAQPGAAVVRPQVRLTLGAAVPSLSGSTPADATRVLAARGLTLRVDPAQAGPDWIVTRQRVAPGTIVEFGVAVGATFTAPPGHPPWTLIAVAGGGGLLVIGLVALLVRLARRPKTPKTPKTPPPTTPKPQQSQQSQRTQKTRASKESIVVRTHTGTVIGPDLDELGTSVSVRLEPRYDPGTFTLEEAPR